jgi:restriction system protein
MKHARATYKITDRGKAVLEEASDLTLADLNRYQRLQPTATVENEDEVQLDDAEITPDEIIERNYRDSESILSQELLERVKSSPPDFFERLVIDLLVAMGYGGSREDAGRSIGRTGDGGVDGLIKEDPLGIEMLYVQAKRWRNAVGRPLVQAFVGSLEGYHARRGVMATTSKFTDDAEEYIRTIEKRIVLIDGKKLVSLMMGYGIGVSTSQKYEMHKIDNGYFPED